MTRLYHFTKIQNVPSIMRRGLQPYSSCHLVGHLPVVWLDRATNTAGLPSGLGSGLPKTWMAGKSDMALQQSAPACGLKTKCAGLSLDRMGVRTAVHL